MRTLARYLERENISPSAFAKALHVSPSTISRLLNGERGCSIKLAVRIERETGGQVKAARIFEQQIKSAAEESGLT